MSSEFISSIAGIILSLAFSYVPGLSEWYAELDGRSKRLVMLALLVVVAFGSYGFSCTGINGLGLTCDRPGLETLLWSLVAAMASNQSAFLITPQLENVLRSKAQAESKRNTRNGSGEGYASGEQ